jgi:predicted metallo-beta-lactamase superfamily hydrolase
MTSKTDPAIDFGNDDYNPNQYNYTTAKQDGIYMGRLLMRDEIVRLINASNPIPTKAVAKILELIKEITLDVYANDSVR